MTSSIRSGHEQVIVHEQVIPGTDSENDPCNLHSCVPAGRTPTPDPTDGHPSPYFAPDTECILGAKWTSSHCNEPELTLRSSRSQIRFSSALSSKNRNTRIVTGSFSGMSATASGHAQDVHMRVCLAIGDGHAIVRGIAITDMDMQAHKHMGVPFLEYACAYGQTNAHAPLHVHVYTCTCTCRYKHPQTQA